MKVGDIVAGFTGWQEFCRADDRLLEAPLSVLPSPLPAPVSAFVGILGHPAITAYLGVDFLDPQPGQTIVVSAAAGSVGSIAGQLAKRRGARVVGIAGGPAKCQHVVDDLGFDACVDRKDPDWAARLDAALPDGVDGDFENAGGPILDHLLMRLNLDAKILLCGEVAQYNDSGDRGARGRAWSTSTRSTCSARPCAASSSPTTSTAGQKRSARSANCGAPVSSPATRRSSPDSTRRPPALTSLLAGETTGKLVVTVAEPATIPGHPLTTKTP